eukprot:TRINITY_DN4986_c0_g1_i1.p1 TRINITY_DN4986_c0_g1~~TRINITY_DN4986_c0_g1_i1.p1  ORF type:complete len:423 (-),score=134.75 TRINITY_DN4986_c0_g1_i1:140-1408(-)
MCIRDRYQRRVRGPYVAPTLSRASTMSSPLDSGPSSPPDSPGLRAVTAQGGGFGGRQELKDHYHSEWHLHNLKRKVAGLPLLTKEQFARRQAQDKINEDKKKPVGKQAKREARLVRQKEIQEAREEAREAKLEANLQGKKKNTKKTKKKVPKVVDLADKHDYTEKEKPEDEGSEEEWSDELSEEDTDEEENGDEIRIIEGESLFDAEIFDDWATCLEYMFAIYGFEIPEIERVVDMEGLCHYLQLKINHCFRCLYTSKRFRSREAVKHYMDAKGNRRFNTETFKLEFSRFYDKLNIFGDEPAMNCTQEQLDAALEQGMTPSGKKMVPRDLAYVLKQKPKPEDSRKSVLAVQAESDKRLVAMASVYGKAGALAMMKPGFKAGATPYSQLTRKDVNRISRHSVAGQLKANKLFTLSDAALTHGR